MAAVALNVVSRAQSRHDAHIFDADDVAARDRADALEPGAEVERPAFVHAPVVVDERRVAVVVQRRSARRPDSSRAPDSPGTNIGINRPAESRSGLPSARLRVV